RNLLELAKLNGKATGNVSTAELQDATPAALLAHVTARKCYGPEATSKQCPSNALENGGAAAENHVRAGLQPLLGDRAGAAVLQ
ncbi:alkaline phosphatase, partial [Pseudomonas aeruginosa]|uniref:alkaline phosphatase n=1 Tax=Pseudomonas aeruginosa TaxID=287 RepID=UPI0024BC0F7D